MPAVDPAEHDAELARGAQPAQATSSTGRVLRARSMFLGLRCQYAEERVVSTEDDWPLCGTLLCFVNDDKHISGLRRMRVGVMHSQLCLLGGDTSSLARIPKVSLSKCAWCAYWPVAWQSARSALAALKHLDRSITVNRVLDNHIPHSRKVLRGLITPGISFISL